MLFREPHREIFKKGFAPWGTYVQYRPMIRVETRPAEKCKITAAVLYHVFSNMTINDILYTFENRSAPLKNVVDTMIKECSGPCRVVTNYNAVLFCSFHTFLLTE